MSRSSGSGEIAHSPRYEVTVGGTTYTEAGGQVSDIVVDTSIDGADRVQLTMNAPFDREQGEFMGFDYGAFSTGTSVKVKTGWGGNGSLQPVFVGEIETLSTNFSNGSGPSVGVSGYGTMHPMMRGTKDRSWEEMAVTDIVDEVLSEHFGDKTVEGGGMERTKIYQERETDYQLVERLANKYGYQFYTKQNEAFFEPRESLGGDSVATLHWGARLTSFSADINEAQAVKKVEVRHWDMENEKEIVGEAEDDEVKNDKKVVFRKNCDSEEDASKIAESKLESLSTSVASGNGESARGIPYLTAGSTITLEGMGSKFSSDYNVTQATHRLGGSGYSMSFQAEEVP
jgi:phage protein D